MTPVATTQGTVWTFDADSCAGEVALDDGVRLSFDAAVFAASGLRLLRAGQRVRLELSDGVVTAMTILTLDAPR